MKLKEKYFKIDKKNNCCHNILQFFQTATDTLKYASPLSELSFKSCVTEPLRSQIFIVLINFQEKSRLNSLHFCEF